MTGKGGLNGLPYFFAIITLQIILTFVEINHRNGVKQMATLYKVDFKGHKNVDAQEIPSAVGMVGLYIPALGGDFDFSSHDFKARVARGEFRKV